MERTLSPPSLSTACVPIFKIVTTKIVLMGSHIIYIRVGGGEENVCISCRRLSFQSYWQTCWSRIGKGFSCRKHTLATCGQWWTVPYCYTAWKCHISRFPHSLYICVSSLVKAKWWRLSTLSTREFQSVVALTFTFTTSTVDWTTLTSARVDMCMCAPAPNCSIKIDSGGEWFAL